jgi:hypothetical protein
MANQFAESGELSQDIGDERRGDHSYTVIHAILRVYSV